MTEILQQLLDDLVERFALSFHIDEAVEIANNYFKEKIDEYQFADDHIEYLFDSSLSEDGKLRYRFHIPLESMRKNSVADGLYMREIRKMTITRIYEIWEKQYRQTCQGIRKVG